MAKPTQENTNDKDIKQEGNNPSFILINIVTTTIVCIIFIGVSYFLQ